MSDFRNHIGAKLRALNPQQIAAFLRTAGQVAGGITGWVWMNEDAFISGVGWIISGTLLLWGMWARRDEALINSAATVPVVEKVVTAPEVAASTPSDKVVPATPMNLMPLFALAIILPFIVGCVSTGPAPTLTQVTVAPTRVDTAVYNASQQVARYCSLLRFGVGVGSYFAQTEQHALYVQRAQTVVANYCDRPFGDVAGALRFLAQAYEDIMRVPAVNVAVRDASLRL